MREFLLTIDSGNSNLKHCFFQRESQEWTQYTKSLDSSKYDTVISNVSDESYKSQVAISGQTYLVKDYIKNKNFIDMPFNYSLRIGEDRIVQSYYLYKNSPDATILIDAGSFVTIDVITQDGLEGGYIYPGINTFLGQYKDGKQLPHYNLNELAEFVQEQSSDIPHDTNEAIMKSVYETYSSIVFKLLKKYHAKKIIITGGDSNILKNFFSKAIEIKDLNYKSLCYFYEQVAE